MALMSNQSVGSSLNISQYAPLFFDQKRFQADLEKQDPIKVFRDALDASKSHFKNRFYEGEDIHNLVNESARFADIILAFAWDRYEWQDDVSLIAVGGYGRGELHPHSDIDLLILMKRDRSSHYRSNIEGFIAFLWDIQLKIGHSVRSISQCVTEAKSDLTVATNLMETRLVAGNRQPLLDMLRKTGPDQIWASTDFYKGKMIEQSLRHQKHGDTEYNLEPNIKEAPGGLRDIQLLNWTAKRHFNVYRRSQLVQKGFLSEEEYLTIRRDEEFLWSVRFGLHLIAGRSEERLLFDHQRKLSEMLGYQDSKGRLGIEKFMQRYYQTVLSIRELNDVLMQYLDEAIYRRGKTKKVAVLNDRFVVRDNYIDTTSEDTFRKNPSALLELFVILGENDKITGIRASTIRQIRLHRNFVDEKFRESSQNKELFLRLLRVPFKLSLQLQRMNRYGILGKYLPEFGKIVGQTQHDLFHIYPVDVHTLQVIKNLRRFVRPEIAKLFSVASHIYKNLAKPELIIIAALYHDIAKGRGGDHSVLGAVEITEFAKRHGLQPEEINILNWVVENHLLMSTVSQKQDISDPEVVHKFADHVGSIRHLELLYLLTVADINATNPRLWTDWKGSLINNLYFETKRLLEQGMETLEEKDSWVISAKTSAVKILETFGVPQEHAKLIWQDVGDELFLRERAEDIATFTKAIYFSKSDDEPIILLRDVGVEIPVATQIFVYAKNRQRIFSVISAVLDKLQLNIQDARLQSTSDDQAFDIFYVLDDKDLPIGGDKKLCQSVIKKLAEGIKNPNFARFNIQRRTPRVLKHFSLKTSAKITNKTGANTTSLEIITPDRPGLLAHLASILLRFEINIYNAKIATLGERVEDVFYITDLHHNLLINDDFNKELQETICQELDARNDFERQNSYTPQKKRRQSNA